MAVARTTSSSAYSLVDSLVRIKPLAKRCADMQMPALALTDFCNMFALVKFQRATIDAGIKPIYGADVLVESKFPDEPASQIVLLATHRPVAVPLAPPSDR